MCSRNSGGSAAGANMFMYSSFGLRLEMTADARSVSPDPVTTPTARSPSTSTSRTGVPTRMTTPRAAAQRAMAWVMAPGAALAVHLTEHVVQQHVGGAGRIRARVVADDAIETVHGLDWVALEPAVEVVPGGHRKQRQQLAPLRHVELAQTAAEARRAYQLGQRRAPAALQHVRRRREDDVAQHVRDALEALRVIGQARGVARREARHLLLGASAAAEEVAAVRGGQEV